ncbi:hypothetical protein HID58_072066 [Brassica napus]|uniref:Uncharacterized protein n=1 Tax=Brassica napus TaxID=3708 RepID=A0ABQ7Z3J6_BRANA|nr:hypothetical protein HID58_072066 [Brassica napus]
MKQRLYRLPLEANLVISQVTIWGTQRHNKATSTYSRGHLVRRQAIEILTLLQESFKPVYKNHLLSKILRLNLKRSNVAYNSNNAKMRNGTMYIF